MFHFNKNLIKTEGIFYIALILIVIFHFINNLIILNIDDVQLTGHNGDNYVKTLRFYEVITKNPFLLFSVITYYPPFFTLLPIPFLWIFGKTLLVAIMSNTIYLFILLFSTYGIGKHMHSKKVGLLAAFIVSMSPSVYGFSRMFWPDFPLASIVTLSIFLLLKTDSFQNRKYSLLLGISVGIGMLTKWSFFMYLIFPLAALLIFKVDSKKKMNIKNLFFACTVALFIAFPWYFKNLVPAVKMSLAGEKSLSLYSISYIDRFFINIKNLYNIQLCLFYSIVFTLCLSFFLFLKKYPYKRFILAWLIGTLLLVSVLKANTPRYAISIIPPIALLISIVVFRIKLSMFKRLNLLVRVVLILLIVIASFAQFFYLCYVTKPKGIFTAYDMANREQIIGLLHPEKVGWIEELDDLINLMKENSRDKTALLLTAETNMPLIGYVLSEIQIRKLPILFDNVMGCFFGTLTTCTPERYYDRISNATFIITHECDNGSIECRAINHNRESLDAYYWPFMEIFESQKEEFEVLKRIGLGDNSTVVLYYRIKEHENG